MQNMEVGENSSNRSQDQTRSDSNDERNRVTELFSSIRNGNLYAVRKLLEEGVKTDVIDRNNKDNTPLHYAIEKCRKEIAEELLLPQWKTDVNAKNSKGNTPLHIAASKGSKDLVGLLLNRQTETDVRNHESKTPLDLTDDIEIQNILKKSYLLSINSALFKETKFRFRSQSDTYSDSQLSIQQSPLNDKFRIQTEESIKKPQSFPTRPGTSNISGHLYEIHICALLLLQALEKREDGKIKKIRLASNVDGLGDFDDIFFEYIYKDQLQNEKSKTIFLQAKHIDEVEKKKITTSVLLSQSKTKYFERKFGLNKYYNSYRRIKQQFSKNKDHPIFRSQFEDSDREFIIYTNALTDFNENSNNIFNKVDEEHILYLGGTAHSSNCNKLIFSGNEIEKVIKAIRCSSYGEQEDNSVTLLDSSTQGSEQKTTGDDSLKKNIISEETICQHRKLQSISAKETGDRKKSADDLETPEESLASLDNEHFEESEMREFLSKLKIFVHQPNEEQISDIIKEKIQLFYGIEERDADSVFSEVKAKVEKWWKDKKGTKNFLTEDNRFFQDTVRVSILFNVKKPVDLFTGRSQDLINLHNLIQRNHENVTSISRITVISGLGGIGKTELARQYIYKHRHCYDDNVIWINAENELSLTESFLLLARDKIRINTRNSNEEEKDIKIILEEVYDFFRKRKCLFVFDNADRSTHLHEFLPNCPAGPGQHDPYILITSRDQEWQRGVEVIPLKELNTEDAKELVKKGLDISHEDTSQDQKITDLVTKLQCFPLAIWQAVAYIADQEITRNFSASDYLTEYEESKKEILNCEIFSNCIHNDYTKTTFTTWKITVDKIRSQQCGQLALLVLNVMAYFRRENIKRDIFLCLADNEEKKLRSAVRLLVKYSLIRGEQGQSILCIHTLVQEVIRLHLKESEEEEEILSTALQLMATKIDRETVNHAISVFNYASPYEELIKKYANISTDIISELNRSVRYNEAHSFAADVLKLVHEFGSHCSDVFIIELFTKNSIANILHGQGKYDECLKIWKELYVIQKETFGENNVYALCSKREVANTLSNQGKYEEALKSYKEILDAGKKVLTEDHKLMLLTRFSMAKTWYFQGRYNQALESLKEVQTALERTEGKKHFLTLTVKQAIGDVLFRMDEYQKALNIYTELCEISKLTSGKESREVLCIKKDIVKVLNTLGKYEDSLALYKEILNTENKYFAEDRLSILCTKYFIADTLRNIGDSENALEISEEVHCERKVILGVYHPETLNAEQSVADALRELGEYDKAFEHYENVLKYRITSLGSAHPHTLAARNRIGDLLLKQGKHEQALPILEEVYNKEKCLRGELHYHTVNAKSSLAQALLANGRKDEALDLFLEVLKGYKTVLGEKHPNAIITKNNIAFVLSEKGEEKKAFELLQEVYRDRVNILGDTHPKTLIAQRNIAECYAKFQMHDEGLNILYQILEINKKRNDYSFALDTEQAIAAAWSKKGNYDVALNIYQEVLDKTTEAYGETNPETLIIRRNMGSVLMNQGKYKEGIKIYRKVLKNQKEILCPEHPDIRKTVVFLDKALKVIGWTRLHLAAYDGDETEITSTLDEGSDINCCTKDGFKPLHLAVGNNNKETVNTLISYTKKKTLPQKQCPLINDKAQQSGETALHMGVSNDNKEIVEILLWNGAHYDLEDERRKVPLNLAKPGSDVKNILQCIDSLFTAVQNGKKDEVRDLLESQQNLGTLKVILHARNRYEQTAINVAANKRRGDIVEMLVDKIQDLPSTA